MRGAVIASTPTKSIPAKRARVLVSKVMGKRSGIYRIRTPEPVPLWGNGQGNYRIRTPEPVPLSGWSCLQVRGDTHGTEIRSPIHVKPELKELCWRDAVHRTDLTASLSRNS